MDKSRERELYINPVVRRRRALKSMLHFASSRPADRDETAGGAERSFRPVGASKKIS